MLRFAEPFGLLLMHEPESLQPLTELLRRSVSLDPQFPQSSLQLRFRTSDFCSKYTIRPRFRMPSLDARYKTVRRRVLIQFPTLYSTYKVAEECRSKSFTPITWKSSV